MRDRRYFLFVGLLLAAVVVWQFGTHEAENLNPLDDSAVAGAQDAASPAAAKFDREAARRMSRIAARAFRHAGSHPARPAYATDELMLRPARGVALADIAADHGATVSRRTGLSGFGAIAVPRGQYRQDLLDQLRTDPRVENAAALGLMYGAQDAGEDASLLAYQWHLEAIDPIDDNDEVMPDFSSLVVAVLDTGVAYEDHSDGLGTYVQAPSLSGTQIIAPYDFVNLDNHANDDHQHGTHIASLIASAGAVEGVAPGVALMPLKVLDADNCGTELGLVDALWHAIDNGADIVNMSLSFTEGYLLSPALDEALQAAWDAGIVLVGAAGNDGAEFVSYPAAHVHVMAVGATRLKDDGYHVDEVDYTNRHPGVDLVAPGGDVTLDEDENGVVDGILAETIALQDPSTISYMLYAGTSQATAVTSGTAAWLLAVGATHEETYSALQLGASSLGSEWTDGYGQGKLRLREADKKYDDGKAVPANQYYVSILPFLKDGGDDVEPKVEITVRDETGALAAGVKVYGVFSGSSNDVFDCQTDGDGRCEAKGEKVDRYDESGDPLPLAWSVSVATCKKDNVGSHPRTAFFAPDALEILLTALDQEADLADALLAFHWPQAKDEYIGEDLLDSYFIVDTGAGLGSCPLGVIFTRELLGSGDDTTTYELDLDGTGLGSCPLGTIGISRFFLDGTGLGSCPLGNVRMPIMAFDGSGLGSCPLGFRPPQVFTGSGQYYDSDLVAHDGAPVLLGTEPWTPADLTGSSLGTSLDTGSWFTAEGYTGATAFVGSGNVAGMIGSGEDMVGSGLGTVLFTPAD